MSPVKYHLLDESNETLTVPKLVEMDEPFAFVMEPERLPVNVDESEMLSVKVESLPTRISPVKICPLAFRVAMLDAPLQPSSQTDNKTPSPLSLIVTPLRLITAAVLVTWKRCPDVLFRTPPVIEKLDVPLDESPDID